jgi:hypothetical protein
MTAKSANGLTEDGIVVPRRRVFGQGAGVEEPEFELIFKSWNDYRRGAVAAL